MYFTQIPFFTVDNVVASLYLFWHQKRDSVSYVIASKVVHGSCKGRNIFLMYKKIYYIIRVCVYVLGRFLKHDLHFLQLCNLI